MSVNPFPGPQPYRASDRGRFYGREDLSRELEGAILANPCVTVHGPSGAGKSSLVQASVVPRMKDVHDIRLVRVDRWPEAEPLILWLARAMYGELHLGEIPPDLPPADAVLTAVKRAARGSPRILLVYLDQIEQVLSPGRDLTDVERFFECLNDLVELPLRTLRVVLSLREDYLGRLRDRLRDRRRLLDSGFRIGPLTVADLASAVCHAAGSGDPPQQWEEAQMLTLMRTVRVPGQAPTDDAEAQSAYAQIVCRALFAQRAAGQAEAGSEIEAEPILRHYIDATLEELGPLRGAAQRVLEDHLIGADGCRTLRTEKELLRIVAAEDLKPILTGLEAAAILHAEEHQGSRYFEIGHDWLARWVFEQRLAKESVAEQRRREEAQRVALERARRTRRIFVMITIAALIVAACMTTLGLLAVRQNVAADRARKLALEEKRLAEVRRSEAHDATIFAGYRELHVKGKHALALKLLPEVDAPAKRRGWIELASDALNESALRVSLEGHTGPLSAAEWSPDGQKILTASADGTARIWTTGGLGAPIVLTEPVAAVIDAAWSNDGKRIALASTDGAAYVFNAADGGLAHAWKREGRGLRCLAWSPDDTRLLTISGDGAAWIQLAGGRGATIELRLPRARHMCAAWSKDGRYVFTGGDDGIVRRWDGKPGRAPITIGRHGKAVLFLAPSPDGATLLSTSADGTARLFRADGRGPAEGPVMRHDGAITHAAWSPDGKLIATASKDRTARIFSVDNSKETVLLEGHSKAVTHVSFRPDGLFVATACVDETARIYSIAGGPPLLLRGHDAPISSIKWSPDGNSLLTAASDRSNRSDDRTAKVWSADPLRWMPRAARGSHVIHTAFVGVDGASFVTASDDGLARLFRIDGADPPLTIGEPAGWLTSAAISPAVDRIVTTSFGGIAHVFRVDDRSAPISLLGHHGDVRFAVFSPDGKRILTGADDSNAMIFPADGEGPPVVLSGHEDWLTAGAFSPDGKRVVTASLDGTARLWNAESGGLEATFSGHHGEVLSVVFLPKDERIVTGSADRTARVWRQDGSYVTLPHAAPVTGLAVSADGSRFATVSQERTIKIWRSDLGGSPITLTSPMPVLALAFLRGATEIVAIGQGGATHHWKLDIDELLSRLWTANAECLPMEMRLAYLDEPPEIAAERSELCMRSPMSPPVRPRRWAGEEEPPSAESFVAERSRSVTDQPGVWKPLERGLIRVKLIVLPADAEVELEGVELRRRNGVIELSGELGERRMLRVEKGARFEEYWVTITATGASPARIDAFAAPTGGQGAHEKELDADDGALNEEVFGDPMPETLE